LLGGKKVHPRRQNPGYAYELSYRGETALQDGLVMAKSGIKTLIGRQYFTDSIIHVGLSSTAVT